MDAKQDHCLSHDNLREPKDLGENMRLLLYIDDGSWVQKEG